MGESRARTFVYVTVSAGILAMLASSCRDPTQVTLILTTTAACGSDVTSTSIYVASDPVAVNTQMAENSPVAQTSNCSGTTIGTLVLTRGTSTGAVVIVAGGAQCVNANQGCIIARRSFSFVEHTSLTIPIELDPSCENVPCDEYSTCENGTCRSANITCTDSGTCSSPGQNPVDPDAGGAVDGASANESGTSPNDGSFAGPDGSTTSGDGGNPTGSGAACVPDTTGNPDVLSCGTMPSCTPGSAYECCSNTTSSADAVCLLQKNAPLCDTRYCCSDADCELNTVSFPLMPHPRHPIGAGLDGGGDGGPGVDSGTQGVASCNGYDAIHHTPGTCSMN